MASDEFDAARLDETRLDPGGPRRSLDAPVDLPGRWPDEPPAVPEPAVPKMWDPATVERRRRRSRLVSWAVIVLSSAVIAGALAWVGMRENRRLEVTGLTVTAPEGLLACETATRSRTVRLTATLTLNGGAGEIRYRWRQSDRDAGPESALWVEAGQERLLVPLDWQVSGEGRTELTGTFELRTPAVREASASFEYSCR